MTSLVKTVWTEVLKPMVTRPNRFQVAALCYRDELRDTPEILLITSRDTGRWVLPKGWPIGGCNASEAARVEAWEEAGVVASTVCNDAIGTFSYEKKLESGAGVRCDVKVFPIQVEELANDFPERQERTRKWVSANTAANMVREPELQKLLRAL